MLISRIHLPARSVQSKTMISQSNEGKQIYQFKCESCHGVFGLVDGVAGINFDPAPSPIGMTSLILSDEFLFWRISEGGALYGTAIPSFDSMLDEKDLWDLINYLRYHCWYDG